MSTLAVVVGGLSAESSTARLATTIAKEVGADDVITIQLRDYAHELTDMALTGMPGAHLREAFEAIARADGVIVAAPVYNAAPLGVATLFLQMLDDAMLCSMPVLIAGTGGTTRHSLALDTHIRPLISYLKGLPMPTTIFVATEDWGASEQDTHMRARIKQGAAELREHMALRETRDTTPVDDLDPDSVVPFADLLSAASPKPEQ